MKKNTILLISLVVGLFVSITVSNFTTFASECDDIRSKVFRIHVIANSDSKEDQALKLKVRDAVLNGTKEIFNNSSKTEAMLTTANMLEEIKQIAQQEVFVNGYQYKVNAEILNMYFSTREYDTFTMPAGYYDALRITIGEAKGKNWWCVLFPQLCIPSAIKKDDVEEVLTKEEMSILFDKEQYVFKFKIVEVLQKIRKSIKEFAF